MKNDFNIEELIGTEIGILDEHGKETKTITIIKAVNTKNGLVVFDKYGTPYHEEELAFSYKLTPEFLLYETLYNNDIELPDWEPKIWNIIFNEFMNSLVTAGYVAEKSSNKN